MLSKGGKYERDKTNRQTFFRVWPSNFRKNALECLTFEKSRECKDHSVGKKFSFENSPLGGPKGYRKKNVSYPATNSFKLWKCFLKSLDEN